MFNKEKLFTDIKNVHAGNYDATWQECLAIATKNGNNAFECICDAFRFGFLKGQRAAKAEARRKAVRQ